jgi:hypothetical protein
VPKTTFCVVGDRETVIDFTTSSRLRLSTVGRGEQELRPTTQNVSVETFWSPAPTRLFFLMKKYGSVSRKRKKIMRRHDFYVVCGPTRNRPTVTKSITTKYCRTRLGLLADYHQTLWPPPFRFLVDLTKYNR